MSRVGYVCIEESFDIILNMGCGGGAVYGSRKSAMAEGVNIMFSYFTESLITDKSIYKHGIYIR